MSSSPSLQRLRAQGGARPPWLAGGLAAVLLALVISWGPFEPATSADSDSVRQRDRPSDSGTLPVVPIASSQPHQPEPESTIVENAPYLAVELRGLSWEAQIRAILGSQLPAANKAQILLQQLPHVPGEGQASVAEAAVENLPDHAYSSVVLRTLLDPRTHGAAESVLFADLLERPDPVALPALLRLMQVPDHPFAPSARETLALLLGEDHGTDPGPWDRAIQQHLATPE